MHEQVSPAEAYQLCRYDWMHEALAVLLERLSVIEPVAAAGAAVQELTDTTIKTLYSIGCKVIFRIGQSSRYYS
jgi:hypothetical protein